MSPTFRLGRIAGVEISVNWSWAIVFVLIVWSLGAEVFPEERPGLPWPAYAAMALAGTLLFFGSLLLHELGHAVQARREGMAIEGITLWLFGGVAQLRGQFASAWAELRIAVAGPAVTAVLGAVFVALAVLGHVPGPVETVVAWLGLINFFLLGFNLLPALPLDGGRVLRALLWAGKRDFAQATQAAVRVSYAIAGAMAGVGFLLFVATGSVGGIWIAFLGWFLVTAASAEKQQLGTRQALQGLKVRDLMIGDPVTAAPGQTLRQWMEEVPLAGRFTAYPVVADGHAVGILPLARVLAHPMSEWDRVRVADCMLRADEVPLLREDEDALEGLYDLAGGSLHRGLVLEDDRLAGYVSITDMARRVHARHS